MRRGSSNRFQSSTDPWLRRTGPDEMGEIWLVTSNPFDVVGARAAGMKAAWVDREGVDGCLDPWGRRKADCDCQWIRGRH